MCAFRKYKISNRSSFESSLRFHYFVYIWSYYSVVETKIEYLHVDCTVGIYTHTHTHTRSNYVQSLTILEGFVLRFTRQFSL